MTLEEAPWFVCIGKVWLMWTRQGRLYYAKAEPPCMKGALDIGCLSIGWQKGEWTK